mmetsp:Transcript_1371/g.1514  ORF Transcript_1371/g.1514 Transcript_1371/m.1514 type:complete len:356 (+) Transcript_1371:276-1343(+)
MFRGFAHTVPRFLMPALRTRKRGLLTGFALASSSLAAYSLSENFETEAFFSGSFEEEEEAAKKRKEKEKKLSDWNGTGYTLQKLDRGDLHGVEKYRHVIALIGVTGSGKSSTANTLMSGSHKRYFEVADSLTSVTRSTSFRDYEFQGIPFRVIDTPGFGDTNRDTDEVEREIKDFKKFAEHGVSCFLIVLPKGRITEESEKILLRAKHLFGDDFSKHAVVVFTHGLGSDKIGMTRQLLTRDLLIEEINKLEPNHFLRELVQEVDLRVMAIENRLQPYKRISKFRLHQAVLDIEKANSNSRFVGIQIEGTKPKEHTHSVCKEKIVEHLNGDTSINIRCEKGSSIPKLLQSLLQEIK